MLKCILSYKIIWHVPGNQILVFSLLTRRLLMMPPSFLNFLIIFLYLTLIGKKHWGFGDKHYWFT